MARPSPIFGLEEVSSVEDHPDYLDWMLRQDFPRDIQDTLRPEGVVPKRRRVSLTPEYAIRRERERLVPL